METEQLIQQALAEVMKGRTTFVIAHRVSTHAAEPMRSSCSMRAGSWSGAATRSCSAAAASTGACTIQFRDAAGAGPRPAGEGQEPQGTAGAVHTAGAGGGGTVPILRPAGEGAP